MPTLTLFRLRAPLVLPAIFGIALAGPASAQTPAAAASVRVHAIPSGRVVMTITAPRANGAPVVIADTTSRDSADMWLDVTRMFLSMPPMERLSSGDYIGHVGEWRGPLFGRTIRITRAAPTTTTPPTAPTAAPGAKAAAGAAAAAPATQGTYTTPSTPNISAGDVSVELGPLFRPLADSLSSVIGKMPESPSRCMAKAAEHVAGTPYEIDEVDRPVVGLPDGPRPIMPPKLVEQKMQASVGVEYVIKEDGTVDPASVSPFGDVHPELLAAVKDALSRSRYVPGRCGGKPVQVSVQQLFKFQ